jgi:hypothetical protein
MVTIHYVDRKVSVTSVLSTTRVECYSSCYVHFYSDCSRALLDKLLVTNLIKKRPDFYETKNINCYVHKSLAKNYVQSQLNPIHTHTYAC